MSLALAQQLRSAQFRVCLRKAVEGGDANSSAMRAVVALLAGGDVEMGMEALGHLIADCNDRNEGALVVLTLFLDGALDVGGVRDGHFAWVSSEMGMEALKK